MASAREHGHASTACPAQLRDEFLNANKFITMHDLQEKMQA